MRLGILGGNVYIDFLISGIVELPAAFLILFTIERIGRHLPFATANIVSGAACLITAFIPEIGVIGACGQINGRGLNLGYVQSSLQAASDGSISIVYLNGDKCGSQGRYSTRVIFQCDDNPGSPVFDFKDGCEYVFIWRTSEACPVKRVMGKDCKVKDPRSGYEYNLMPLSGKDYEVKSAHDGHGNSYDLSSLARHNTNWVVLPQTGSKDQRYYINVCKSLVPQSGYESGLLFNVYCLLDGNVVCLYVKCSVWNGTSLLDLSPLIHLNGYYTATDEDLDKDKSPDFYINICQPLQSQ
ncbi:hypothetical protein SRHO_G00065270 [Serrasalmus rhombeus]